MAIHDEQNVQQQVPVQAQSQQKQPFPTQVGMGGVFATDDKWGVFDIGRDFASMNFTSEALVKVVESLTMTYKAMSLPSQVEIRVTPIDRNKEQQLYLSCVIVSVSTGPNQPAAYHTLLIESSNDPLQPRVENIGNRQVRLDRLASDVYDSDYQNIVQQVIQAQYPGVDIYPCSAQVVPRHFDLTDKDSVRRLAVNALRPAYFDIASSQEDFTDMDLTKFDNEARLGITFAFNNDNSATMMDYTDLPVRSPISVSLTANSHQRQSPHKINSAEQSKKVSELGGFIDFISIENPVNNAYAPIPQVPRPKLAARFVMTNLENRLLMTIPSQLLALVTAMTLQENNNWYPAFAPKLNTKGVDYNDIGALNIHANVFNTPGDVGEPLDTKSVTFTTQSIGQFFSQALRPELVFSLDVSMCGSDTWYNEVFLAAAQGNQNAASAIINGANKLTGGLFGKYYDTNESPVWVNDDIVHLGYYVDSDGKRRDIREIDYLAVLNLVGEKDPQAASDWIQTYMNLSYPVAQRLDERRKRIVDIVRGEVVFTGFAHRVTFTNVFLDALLRAFRETNVPFTINSVMGIDYMQQRSVWQNFAGTAVSPITGTFFNNTYQQHQPFSNHQFGQRYYNYR